MEEKTSNVMDSTSNIEYIMMQAACPEEEPYSSSDRCNESPPKKKNKKWYFQPFNREWLMDPKFKEWLTSDPNDKYVALCKVCDVKFRNSNKTALFRHRETQKHQKKLKNFSTRKNTVDINTFRSPKEPDPQDEVSKDEHQVPLRQAGHLVETLKKMFSDSTTAPQSMSLNEQQYLCNAIAREKRLLLQTFARTKDSPR